MNEAFLRDFFHMPRAIAPTKKVKRSDVIEECAKVAEAHKSCGCSCSDRIPRVIAADIRKLK